MILLIDNYDSYLEPVPILLRTGADVLVRRNDELTLAQIDALARKKS
jgi:para-aminobenzoate synthetase component 2